MRICRTMADSRRISVTVPGHGRLVADCRSAGSLAERGVAK